MYKVGAGWAHFVSLARIIESGGQPKIKMDQAAGQLAARPAPSLRTASGPRRARRAQKSWHRPDVSRPRGRPCTTARKLEDNQPSRTVRAGLPALFRGPRRCKAHAWGIGGTLRMFERRSAQPLPPTPPMRAVYPAHAPNWHRRFCTRTPKRAASRHARTRATCG